jgi:hypothetical protein
MSRSQDEIVARIEGITDDEDVLGWSRDVLLGGLDYEHARPYLKPEITEAQWTEATANVETEARNYLAFAIGKIRNHRGISASRSVDKLRAFAWLLGRDDVVAAMDAADYPQYGAPKVKAFAEGMGWDWPDHADLGRMAQGLPCEDTCADGCGQ